jgi:excisionase family DNA binding protein
VLEFRTWDDLLEDMTRKGPGHHPISIGQAAMALKVAPSTIEKMLDSGELTGIRVGESQAVGVRAKDVEEMSKRWKVG